MRLDKYLARENPALSRTKIKTLIEGGYVAVSGKIVDKPSYEIGEDADFSEIVITGQPIELDYVGRGGVKLAAALDFFGVDVTGMKACDIGASTGGFTDCLIRRGAESVCAVDSGRDQLHTSLRADARVISVEGFNARDLGVRETGGLCDIAVCDVSFISQTHIIPSAVRILRDGGIYIGLVKPQFEAGRAHVGKNGIVKDKKAHFAAAAAVIDCAEASGLECMGLIKSPVKGGDGNAEFLMMCVKRRDKIHEFPRGRIEECTEK